MIVLYTFEITVINNNYNDTSLQKTTKKLSNKTIGYENLPTANKNQLKKCR